MKKSIKAIHPAAALALSLVLGISGCSRPAQQPGDSVESQAEAETGGVGLNDTKELADGTVPDAEGEQSGASAGESGAGQATDNEEGEKVGQEAERDVLYPVIRTGYCSSSSEDGTVWYARGNYPQISLRNTGYEGLAGALASWNEQVKAQTEQSVEEIGASAREFFEDLELPDDMKSQSSLPYESGGSAVITRADQDVFSMRYDVSSYTGGAHGNYGVEGYNFDSRSGRKLALEDVIADREGLYERLLAFLDEQYGPDQMLFEGYEDTVRDLVFENEVGGYPMSLTWTLGPGGMTVYFNQYLIAPYAAGLLTVDIPYEGNEAVFKDGGLFAERTASVVPVRMYETMYLDRDGVRDELYLSEDFGESGYDSQVHIRLNGADTEGYGGYGISSSYLMRRETQDGKQHTWLYLETSSDNDYRNLTVYDLSGGAVRLVGECGEGSFYENVPSDPDSFYLTSRLDLLSTYTGYRRFRIGEDGMPEAMEEFYAIDGEGLAVTTKMEVPAFSGEGMDEPCLIPAGTGVTFLRTDGESWVEMETPDGSIYRVKVSREWPQSIDGTEIEAYFDNLRFAG